MSRTKEFFCYNLNQISSTLCNFDQSSMLLLYRKYKSNVAQFVWYVTYLSTTKHVDLIVSDFNEDSLNEGPTTILLKSLGFAQIVSEPTHIRGVCFDQIYIRNKQNSFFRFSCDSQQWLLF